MSRRVAGLSLAEAVISIFLLVAGLLLVVRMIHQNFRYVREHEQRARAVAAAESVMAEIRDWARDKRNFRSDWSTWHNRSVTPAGAPGPVLVEVETERNLYSPCSSFESPWLGRARRMTRSLVAVKATSQWSTAAGGRRMSLFTYVAERPVPLGAIPAVEVARVSGSGALAPLDAAEFHAVLKDADGEEIPDLLFDWHTEAVTGNGLLEPDLFPRGAGRTQLRHEYRLPAGQQAVLDGEVALRAAVRYAGITVVNGLSDELPATRVELSP